MDTLFDFANAWQEEQKERVFDNYDRYGLRASGNFIRETYVETTQSGNKVTSKLMGPDYALQMNDGRAPNQAPSREAVNRLYPIILEWQQNKSSLPAELKTKGAAWGIAYKIVFSGITVPNSFNRGGFLTNAYSPDRLQALYSDLSEFYVEETRTKLNENLKQDASN